MMNEYPAPPRRMGASAESALLTLALLALVVVLLSTVTLVPKGSQLAAGGGLGRRSGLGRALAAAALAGGGGAALAGGGGGLVALAGGVLVPAAGGRTAAGGGRTTAGGTAGGGGTTAGRTAGGTTAGGTTSGGTTSGGTTSGGTTTGGGGVTPAAGIDCRTGRNGGNTDTGVSATSVTLGAVTVDSGPGASFLKPEDIAMQAVTSKVNNAGGICGRKITLKLNDSGWDAATGQRYIANLVSGDRVFALAVNPDSEGLEAARISGDLDRYGVPVMGTDGLLYGQYQSRWIWPIAASTVTAMHAIAVSQGASGKRAFSLVYEKTYRFGREGANAYNNQVKRITGANIPGYSNPDTRALCVQRFCGVVANQQGYGSLAGVINLACRGACDAGAVLLEPTTAITWFSSGGRFGGAQDPRGGVGAAPQPLFARYLADGCQRTCDGLRLWTGFLPPIGTFASGAGVSAYVNDMKAYSSNVDVNNQFAEGAYLGMRFVVDMLAKASAAGLTRANVIRIMDSTSGYDIGLTIRPLSWSPGNHFAATAAHAFDESYPAGFGGWSYVQGSQVTDPDPTHI